MMSINVRPQTEPYARTSSPDSHPAEQARDIARLTVLHRFPVQPSKIRLFRRDQQRCLRSRFVCHRSMFRISQISDKRPSFSLRIFPQLRLRRILDFSPTPCEPSCSESDPQECFKAKGTAHTMSTREAAMKGCRPLADLARFHGQLDSMTIAGQPFAIASSHVCPFSCMCAFLVAITVHAEEVALCDFIEFCIR
jgi:hypothetical protein